MKMDGGGHYNDMLVDQNLIILRQRIHEMTIMEKNYTPPSNWMGWVKKWYKYYDSDVLELVGLSQILLMNSRPSLVLGVLALLILSVFMSSFVILCSLVEIVKGVHF
ncbi:hypothetical protein BUALT_Bualt05G0114600 [Buddleja alternifolia]|uniref:Uncharacterized protein n=1 Tax=Buddleja alternifolia TaxID=168488 RepID=A0AAV6XQ64_9LAMI|nr:hypothetical protein BUALT_Bualt05G0114600 [Buddleja alternifolia]